MVLWRTPCVILSCCKSRAEGAYAFLASRYVAGGSRAEFLISGLKLRLDLDTCPLLVLGSKGQIDMSLKPREVFWNKMYYLDLSCFCLSKFSSFDRMCAKPLILIKKPLSRMHACLGDGKRKGKESITNSDKHQLIYHCFVSCCLERKIPGAWKGEYSIWFLWNFITCRLTPAKCLHHMELLGRGENNKKENP